MKKLLFILLLAGCSSYHDAPLVITSITKLGSHNNKDYYRVYVNNDDTYILTNHIYQIGDTIQ